MSVKKIVKGGLTKREYTAGFISFVLPTGSLYLTTHFVLLLDPPPSTTNISSYHLLICKTTHYKQNRAECWYQGEKQNLSIENVDAWAAVELLGSSWDAKQREKFEQHVTLINTLCFAHQLVNMYEQLASWTYIISF